MRLGIVSDTHGHVPNTRAAVEILEQHDVQAVIHCGDIGSTAVIDQLTAWPAHFVFGNVDRYEDELRHAIESAGHTCHGRFGELELAGRRLAFLHGDDTTRFRQTVSAGTYDLVCYGHTHTAEQHKVGPTLVLNPGALYRARPHSLAVVELPALDVDIVDVDIVEV